MAHPQPIHFKGLNGLRFLAALAVIITHVELLKGHFGFEHRWNEPLIFNLGGLGVYFFFVLSGFLITYLLLAEHQKSGTINIKAFYIRRILRIWPLYYLVVVLGFFVLPQFPSIHVPYLQRAFHDHFYGNFLLYLLILPNLAFSIWPAVPHIGQLWSIGVEEQFYLFWPWLVKKTKSLLRSLLIFIVAILTIKVLVRLLGFYFVSEPWYQPLKLFVAMSKFECMAIGGLGAYFLHQGRIPALVFKTATLFLVLALIVVTVYFFPDKLQDGVHLIQSVFFLAVILNCSVNSRLLEFPVLKYLGKISYGIYMYHFMVIPVVLAFASNHFPRAGLTTNLVIYSMVLVGTVLVSSLSYALFEARFIKLKTKFTVVPSSQ